MLDAHAGRKCQSILARTSFPQVHHKFRGYWMRSLPSLHSCSQIDKKPGPPGSRAWEMGPLNRCWIPNSSWSSLKAEGQTLGMGSRQSWELASAKNPHPYLWTLFSTPRNLPLCLCSFLIFYWTNLTHLSRLSCINTSSVNSPWNSMCGLFLSWHPFTTPLISLAVSLSFPIIMSPSRAEAVFLPSSVSGA